jgi:hypothetical protein
MCMLCLWGFMNVPWPFLCLICLVGGVLCNAGMHVDALP